MLRKITLSVFATALLAVAASPITSIALSTAALAWGAGLGGGI
jgi:hypothetical protein